MLDHIGPDLDGARAKIEASCDELRVFFDSREAPDARLVALVTGLDRMAARVGRVEVAVAESVGEASVTSAPASRNVK